MENNLIYALHCPIQSKPVYVGQSRVGIDRPFDHIKERSHSVKVNDWIKTLKRQGLEPIIFILEHDFDEKYIDDKEKFWINKYLNQGHLLLNQHSVSATFYEVTEFDKVEYDFLFDVRMYVKGRRKMLKFTQKELAERAGVGLRFLRALEQGYKSNFNTASIEKVLLLLGNVKLSVVNVS